ncbi:zinc finger protein 25-like [Episyrphus balteatus]|uniref:zinc finger protein 25-like n=1 Tax=Episyrphus balteatus TaxID=286459 RepID=UPI002485CA1F|nr:zinc finger protein 25-like [Episyrphus balteatus]
MGKLKADCSEDNAPKSDDGELSSQSSQDEFQEEQKVIRTHKGNHRRTLHRRVKKTTNVKVVKRKIKSTQPTTKPIPTNDVSVNNSCNSNKIQTKLDNDPDPDTDSKSDIEEDECIPNGCKFIECFICSCRFSKIYNLRIHMATHLKEDSFDMETFEKSEIFNILNPHKRNINSKTIQQFVIQEIQAKRYSQFYCILNEAAVELHISDSETDSDDANDVIPHNNYRCEMCKKNFDRRYKALFHQKTAHTKKDLVIECDYCLKKFVCMNLLIHHLKTQCESDEKPVPCTERFMKFLLKVNLEYYANLAEAREQKKQKKVNEGPKSYTCKICEKTFTRHEHLNRHSAVHLPDEMKFECAICNRRFNRKDNMRSHMKTHTEEGTRNAESRKILCSYCGRSFSSKSNYVVHMRRHTGEKPYKCDVCGKGFPKSTDLNSHKITHTGAKDYVCTICNKPFARSAVLSKHMKLHSGPYPCTSCDKIFPKPSALTIHLRTHTSGRWCGCLVCNETFQTKGELHMHFAETGHSNEPKRVLVIKEPLVVDKPIENISATTDEELASNVKKKTANDDPLEIDEEEWRTTKVKVPVNEVIKSVLQKSTITTEQEVVKDDSKESDNLIPPFSPIDNGFDDDPQYDW